MLLLLLLLLWPLSSEDNVLLLQSIRRHSRGHHSGSALELRRLSKHRIASGLQLGNVLGLLRRIQHLELRLIQLNHLALLHALWPDDRLLADPLLLLLLGSRSSDNASHRTHKLLLLAHHLMDLSPRALNRLLARRRRRRPLLNCCSSCDYLWSSLCMLLRDDHLSRWTLLLLLLLLLHLLLEIHLLQLNRLSLWMWSRCSPLH